MKWKPVHRYKMQQNKEVERGFDVFKTKRALRALKEGGSFHARA